MATAVAPTNGSGSGSGSGSASAGPPSVREQVEQLVDSNPDQVAAQLRNWMQEG
jgi:flagellar biosynthesis/type III secretory pathway M-ring protein FliF/YscJ